jgi:hypothetical protein
MFLSTAIYLAVFGMEIIHPLTRLRPAAPICSPAGPVVARGAFGLTCLFDGESLNNESAHG